VSGDAGEGNAPRLQVEKEEDVYVTRPRQVRTSTVKKSVPARTAMRVAMKSFQLVLWLRFGAGAMPCRLQNVSDRLIGDLMAEIGESASDAIVTPAFDLLGHAADQRFDFRADARTSRVGAMLRAVELAGDQTAIPGEDGFRFRNTGHLRQTLPPQPLADFGEG
jgi:hypothetical protein